MKSKMKSKKNNIICLIFGSSIGAILVLTANYVLHANIGRHPKWHREDTVFIRYTYYKYVCPDSFYVEDYYLDNNNKFRYDLIPNPFHNKYFPECPKVLRVDESDILAL